MQLHQPINIPAPMNVVPTIHSRLENSYMQSAHPRDISAPMNVVRTICNIRNDVFMQ
jgi:hypothetical protein